MGESPGVRVTMAHQRVASGQYVCELRKHREKRLEKQVGLSKVLKGCYFSEEIR